MTQTHMVDGSLPEAAKHDIVALADHIEAHIKANAAAILEAKRAKLLKAYAEIGDMAYGAYLEWLFRPMHQQMRQAGLRALPKLPGDFNISREWGVPAQNDEQRWMWSTIKPVGRKPIGTIVTITFHDHTQFRLPRPPQIIALTETGKEAVVEALSRRSADFAHAREASIEIAEYLASLENQG